MDRPSRPWSRTVRPPHSGPHPPDRSQFQITRRTLLPRVHLLVTLASSLHLAVVARLALSGLPPPSRRFSYQAAPSFAGLLRHAGAEGLLPPCGRSGLPAHAADL